MINNLTKPLEKKCEKSSDVTGAQEEEEEEEQGLGEEGGEEEGGTGENVR